MKKLYSTKTTRRPATPRNLRGAVANGSSSIIQITQAPTESIKNEGHTHSNYSELERLGVADGYVTIRTAPAEGDGYKVDKTKAVYADTAKIANVLRSADFKPGESGAEIDEAGDAEVGGLLVRDALEVTGDATATTVTATDNVVTPQLTTPNFIPGGLTGEGAGIYTNAGLTYGEFDYIVARRGMTLTELTIEEINSVGGGIIASKAHGVVDKVDNGSSGAVTIWLKDVNQFVAGDLVRYEHYDYATGVRRWAWVKVISSNTASLTIVLNRTDFTSEMTLPQAGDKLVQMGHATNAARQGFVYITTDGVQCYDGVNTTSLAGKCRGVFGDLTGIVDNGTALSGYGVWTDKLYIGTGKTAGATFADITSKFEVVEGRLTSMQQSVTNLGTEVSTIEQTVDSISTRVEEVNGKTDSNTTKITQNASAITTEVSARKSGDATLQSSINQTASSISLRLSQMSLSNINRAIGTENAVRITSDFGNKENKAKRLYDVSGISKGDIITLSLLLRIKGITFGTNGVISLQLSGEYGYRGFPAKISQATLDALTPDADGYYTFRYQSTSTQITTDVDALVVGYLYFRFDYIDADATADNSVIEVSQLKIELGETATAWTARTGDMDEALADTGIDISHKQIKATADNFKILNNTGAVTMEVDADGNLTSNAVLVRNTDPTTAEATPYLTTINLATGYLNTYYPLATNNGNNNLALQIGWDEGTQSVFRFYSKEGVMAWKAGSQASLIDTTQSSQVVISPIDMYKCASTNQESASAEIKTTKSLTATRLYQKVEQSGGTTTTKYYTDVNCTKAVTGYLTDAGLPAIFATNQITGTTYTRQLLAVTNGVASMPLIVKWTSNDATIN